MIDSPDSAPSSLEIESKLQQTLDDTTYQLKSTDLPQEVINSLLADLSIEQLDNVTLGKQIDYLSTSGSIAKEVLVNGKKVGVLIKFESQPGQTSKAMFMHADRSPALFTKKPLPHGEQFVPNIPAMKKYFEDYNNTPGNKHREITMIVNGPTFEVYSESPLTGINYDNGTFVGSEKLLTDEETKKKGIAYITGGRLTLSHTDELTQAQIDQLVSSKADIVTMSSLKREGRLNPSSQLRGHTNSHCLVQFKDGTMGELIINNITKEQKQEILNSLTDISRALYSDADAESNYLDGIRVNTQDGLKYTHPNKGDIFANTKVKEPTMVENNMPGVIIFYTEKN